MISKALEAKITINDKILPILNNNMDINIDWYLKTQEENNGVSVEIVVNSVKGKISYLEKKENYSKTITIDFASDKSWEFSYKKEDYLDGVFYKSLLIQPYTIDINLDNKKIIIKF